MALVAVVRKHWGALILAFIISVSISVPQLVAQYRMGASYSGVHPVVSNDELYYLARAHETLDGHARLGSPYLAEYKNEPAVEMWMPDYLLAKAEITVFGDLKSGFLMWDILLPFMGALVLYAIAFFLTEDIAISLAAVAVLYLGLFFSSLNRTPFPQLAVLLFGAFYCLVRALRSSDWRWWGVTTLLGGSLFYVYPYWWTFWIVLVSLTIIFCFLGVRQEGTWKSLLLTFGGTMLIGVPYFITQYRTSMLPEYADVLRRDAVILTHFPSGIFAVVFALVTLLIYACAYWKKLIPWTSETFLIVASALTGLVVMNQQVLTGLEPQSTEHYTLPAVSMCVLALATVVVPFLRRITTRECFGWAFATICIVFAIAGAIPHILRIATPTPRDIAAERYGPILSWLDTHTKTDDVIYANQTLSSYIPAYTRDNVFFAYLVFQAYIPQMEIDARFAGAHYLDASFTYPDLLATDQSVFGAYHVAQFQHTEMMNIVRKLLGLPASVVERYPNKAINPLMDKIKAVRKGTFQEALGSYRVDYLVWDAIQDSDWRMNRVNGLTQVYAANGLVVYALSMPPR